MSKEEKKVNRRDFLFTASYTVGAVGVGAVIWPMIDQMNPDKAQQALATTEVDISSIEPGKSITMARNPDYWGTNLPFRKGTLNFDEISIEYFGDATVLFEAFKAGEIDIFREGNAEKWETQFNFPAVTNKQVIKSEIPHGRPTGMRG